MRKYIGTSLAVICASASMSQAAVIFSHTGNANPVTESSAWTSVGNGTVLAVNDSGTNAWQITDSSTTDYRLYYDLLTSAQLNNGAGWTATATVRAANNVYNASSGINNWGVAFAVQDAGSLWTLDIVGTDPTPANNGVWYAGPNGAPVKLLSMDTATAYHTYKLVYNPAAPDRIGILIDGVSQGTILRSAVYTNTTPAVTYIDFGSLSAIGSGSGAWSSVTFESGQAVAAVPSIPEPASLSLLGMGALALLSRRRRQA